VLLVFVQGLDGGKRDELGEIAEVGHDESREKKERKKAGIESTG